MERDIKPAKIRVLTYVNIVGKGMGGDWEHEASEMNAQRAAEAAWEFNPFLLGDGAVEDMPLGNESVIAKPPAA